MDVDFRVLERLLDLLVEGPHADAVAVLLADARLLSDFSQYWWNLNEKMPPWNMAPRHWSAVANGAKIVFSEGGFSSATRLAVMAKYDARQPWCEWRPSARASRAFYVDTLGLQVTE